MSDTMGETLGAGAPSTARPAVQSAPGPAARLASRPSPQPLALSFRDVSFAYGAAAGSGGNPVIDHLTWDVATGCVTGLVGLNGCGKSTLLRLADGLVAPTAGEVLVRPPGAAPHVPAPASGVGAVMGVAEAAARAPVPAVPAELVPLASMSSAQRARSVALLMQIHRTPSMTVEDLVMCGRYTHMGAFGRASAQDRRIVADALQEVGVADLAHKPARNLSGGQRQRAFIAMALAQQAQLLLLDEPVTFLDPRAARDVMALVRRLVDERCLTVLAVLHDVDLALRTCDDVAVMQSGRIVDFGPVPEVLARGALERVLDVRIERHEGPCGESFSVF